MRTKAKLSDADIQAFEPEAKIGLLATVDPAGLPHLSLITSIQAKTPTQLMWGQFSEGRSKQHVRANPCTAFLVMNAERQVWRGKAKWTHSAKEGDDYVHFNQLPMFRYNAYFGFHTVHYMDLIELTGPVALSVPRLVAGSLLGMLGKLALDRAPCKILKPWAKAHVSQPDTLKFLAAVGADGYPVIIPALPAHAVGSNRLAIVPTVHYEMLRGIAKGARVAVFALNLQMESVLLRGRLERLRLGLPWQLPAYLLEIDWVYNSMPPLPGQIYPQEPLQPVTDL